MTTEYQCSAIGEDNTIYELLTCNAPLYTQAVEQFNSYIIDQGGEPETLQGVVFNAIEIDD